VSDRDCAVVGGARAGRLEELLVLPPLFLLLLVLPPLAAAMLVKANGVMAWWSGNAGSARWEQGDNISVGQRRPLARPPRPTARQAAARREVARRCGRVGG
jgi:hypothetical protein